jgi:hypothetical protein
MAGTQLQQQRRHAGESTGERRAAALQMASCLNLTSRGPPHASASPFTASHRRISRQARSLTACVQQGRHAAVGHVPSRHQHGTRGLSAKASAPTLLGRARPPRTGPRQGPSPHPHCGWPPPPPCRPRRATSPCASWRCKTSAPKGTPTPAGPPQKQAWTTLLLGGSQLQAWASDACMPAAGCAWLDAAPPEPPPPPPPHPTPPTCSPPDVLGSWCCGGAPAAPPVGMLLCCLHVDSGLLCPGNGTLAEGGIELAPTTGQPPP